MNGIGQPSEQSRSERSERPPTIWFEVEDFLRYFDHFRNPTGLQRVPFEIYVEAERLYGASGRVRFCRLSVYTKQFAPIGFDAVMAAYLNPPGVGAPWTSIWGPARFGRKLSGMLRMIIGHPRFFFSMFKSVARDAVAAGAQRRRFERLVRPGDIVVSLGASWGVPGYLALIAAAKRRYRIRFATLIYDLIPIENQSFVEPWHVVQFRDWLQQALATADVMLSISRYSRNALIRMSADAAWAPPRLEVLELGGALSDRPIAGAGTASAERSINFPPRFVLFVSTIEIRKNHRLLVRVWQRLLERHGADAMPVLVFAGQVGWLVDDLLAELAASHYLGGKVAHLPGLTDAELRQAYQSCLFTVFPSLSEGWGLPVAESLVRGKFCVASNATSIPEVGGDFIDYFDPTDDDDALAKIERVLFEPGYLAAREARLRAEYRPRTWADCAHQLIAELDHAAPADNHQA
jgi:glycosyltransferase involved in cell wall biosynthesis